MKKMLAKKVLGTAGIALFVLASSGAKDKVARFEITIRPSPDCATEGLPEFKADGSRICVVVNIKNSSSRITHFALTDPAFDYLTQVADADGNPVPDTEECRKTKENVGKSNSVPRNIGVRLKPGQATQDAIDVGYLYKMSHPGTYSIQVQRRLGEELGTGIATSNTIKIAVVP